MANGLYDSRIPDYGRMFGATAAQPAAPAMGVPAEGAMPTAGQPASYANVFGAEQPRPSVVSVGGELYPVLPNIPSRVAPTGEWRPPQQSGVFEPGGAGFMMQSPAVRKQKVAQLAALAQANQQRRQEQFALTLAQTQKVLPAQITAQGRQTVAETQEAGRTTRTGQTLTAQQAMQQAELNSARELAQMGIDRDVLIAGVSAKTDLAIAQGKNETEIDQAAASDLAKTQRDLAVMDKRIDLASMQGQYARADALIDLRAKLEAKSADLEAMYGDKASAFSPEAILESAQAGAPTPTAPARGTPEGVSMSASRASVNSAYRRYQEALGTPNEQAAAAAYQSAMDDYTRRFGAE